MAIFCTSLLALTTAFVAHVAVWRFRVPKRQGFALLAVFGLTLALWIAAILLADRFGVHRPEWLAHDGYQLLYVAVFHVTMTGAYLLSLPALEGDSPSSLIVLHLHRKKPSGMTKEELARLITDEAFVLNRVDGLLLGGAIVRSKSSDRFEITASGARFLDFFLFYRRAMRHLFEGG